MKTILKIIILQLAAFSHSAYSQGWRAEIDLDLNHNLYAYERIDNVTLTFSGVKVTGSSPRSTLNLVVTGNDPMNGEVNLSINGTASEPYDPQDPGIKTISLTFSGNYAKLCEKGFFSTQDQTNMEQVSIWITIYPRLQISSFIQQCDRLTLTSNTCTPSFRWEVSDDISEGFKVVEGQTGSKMVITREELVGMGFTNPYGRKYFRVTGLHLTTSQLQPVDIYYPGPTATLLPADPRCHDGMDGKVAIYITSSYPSNIDDFVVTLFRNGPPEIALEQEFILNSADVAFSELLSGNYRVRIENNSSISTFGNCWTDQSFELQNPEAVTIHAAELSDYHGYNITCDGNSDGTITVDAAGGTGNYSTYEWMPAVSTTKSAEGLAEGTYKVSVRDSNGCESAQYPYELRAPKALRVDLISSGGKNGFDVSCHDGSDGQITANITGGVTNYAFAWADGPTNMSRADLAPGQYSLAVTDANGCVTSGAIMLIAPEPIEFSIAELHSVTCAGDYSGILEIQSASNTIGAISYLWSSGETQSRIANKKAGIYSATVTDEQGCTSERSHTLIDPPAYSVNVVTASDYNGSAIRCSGGNDGKLSAIVRDEKEQLAFADNFTWYYNGNKLVSGPSYTSVSQLRSGLYKVEIAYRTFCKTSDTFILTEPASVQVAISTISDYHGVAISCAGERDGALIATATGGTGTKYSYTWNTGREGTEIVNLGAGTYLVTALDINGCAGTAQRSLTEPHPVEAQISILSSYNGQPVSCTDASDARIRAVAMGGTLPYSYTWNRESTATELADVPPGNYHLVVKDANGCTAENDTTVLNPARVIGKIASKSDYHGFGVSCNGMADGYLFSEASGGTGKYSFQWQGSTNTRTLHSNLSAGTYRVYIRDENGCEATTEGILTEPEVLSLELLSSADVSCNKGNDGQIELAATGGSGFYQYSSYGEDWNTASILKNLKAGIYDPIVKDANGCQQSVRLVISEPQEITIDFKELMPALCGDPRGEASAYVTGGTGDYKFEWRDTRQNILGYNAHISFLPAGIFTLHVSDANSCKAVASVGISSTDGPNIAIDNIIATTCSYSADGSATVSVTGEHPPFTIQWADGQLGAEANDLLKGSYLVEVTDDDNCSTVETVSIPGADSLLIELVQKVLPSCNGTCDGKLAINAAGGNGNYQYIWESSSGNSIEGICKGDYTVEVTDQKGCVARSTIPLSEPDGIALEVRSATSPLCPERCDGALEIEASGGVGTLQYLWSPGQTTPSIMNLCAGEYTLTVRDSNQCEMSQHYTLGPPEEYPLDLGGSIVLCKGQTHILDPGPHWERYSWNSNAGFKSSERRAVIANAGTYWVEAVDNLGCVARDTFLLETSTELLKANFLLASQAVVQDTVVIIDISWPVPGEITWTLPKGMKELFSEKEVVYGQFETAGSFDVTLTARLGECRDHITKSVVINEEDGKHDSGRFGYKPFVKEFTLFPNPNDGMFDIAIEFEQESAIQVTIWNVLTSRKVALMRDSGRAKYSKHVDLRPLSSGSYSIRLDYEQGTRYIRFIVK